MAPPPTLAEVLRSLQRQAGNGAVNRLLAQWTLQRAFSRPQEQLDAAQTELSVIEEVDANTATISIANPLAASVGEPHVESHAHRGEGVPAQRVLAPDHIQQAQVTADPYQAAPDLARLPTRGARLVQRTISGSQDLANGTLAINMASQQDAASPIPGGGTSTGLKGDVTFTPNKNLPFSNKIGMIQIVKLTQTTTDDKGKAHTDNAEPASLPTAYGPKLRTAEDKAAGVEEGFFTDILHNDFGSTNKDRPKGSQAAPYYEGGTPVFGFKRSNSEIQAAKLEDFPSSGSKTGIVDFSFETVAKGDDTMQVYGAVKWAFGIHDDKIVNEVGPTFAEGESATFDAALHKHREFYTHEPVTFYFDLNKSEPMDGETDKIDEFLGYLTEFPDVTLALEGTADTRGDAEFNTRLGIKRADAIHAALVGRGVDDSRITIESSSGGTNRFAPAARESNFRANRTVILTFVRNLAAPAPAAPAVPVPATP